MSIVDRIKSSYRALPDKKRYIEFFTALLTVPVLLTVIIANIRNLQSKPATQSAGTGNQTPQVTFIPYEVKSGQQPSVAGTPYPTPTNSLVKECTREVGPVEIISPAEGERVIANPVCIDISYHQGDYCSVVWSYRLNSAPWSQYTDKSICLYNIPPGDQKLDLRVKSIASDDEVLLTRRFTVPAPTPTPEASGSATQP